MTRIAAQLDQIEEIADGRAPFRPVRHHFGITSFGVNAWTAGKVGDRIINEHDEAANGQEELYLVLQGRATFELDGERRDTPAGTLVFVGPGVKRTAFAEEGGTTIIVFGGRVGHTYRVFGWELWAPLAPLYQAGAYAEAADRGRELADANPQFPVLSYNVACCESLTGRTIEALEHLRRALESSPDLHELAKHDSDLDPIRSEPAFAEIVGD